MTDVEDIGDADYSKIADDQFEALRVGPDADLYNAACDAAELIFTAPELAAGYSSTITTEQGLRRVLPVAGYPHKIFWVADGPRIEAIFPWP